MSTKLGDQNSDEWERIKSYVGGANKPAKHPIQQEMDRIDIRKPQHLDDGGMVDPLSDDSKSLLAPQSMGAPSPFQAAPQQVAPPVQAPIQKSAMPPPVQAPIAPPQAAPVAQTPPAPDAAYNPQANQALGGIDPQQLMAMLQKVNTPTLGQKIGSGVSGLADAFSRAGHENSDYQKNFDARQQQTRENLSKIPGEVSTQGKEQYGLSKEMASDDPKSMRSFVQQQANAQLLKQAGFSPEEIKSIPASAIDGLRTGAIDADKVRADYGLRKATIEQTGAYQQGMLANTKSGIQQRGAEIEGNLANQKAERTQKALGDLKDMPWFSRTLHPGISDALKQEAGLGSTSGPQKADSREEYDALPSGTLYVDSYGTQKVKK